MIKRITTLVFAFLTIAGNAVWGQETPPSGTGTENDPYLLGTEADLKWFQKHVSESETNASACAKLIADITLNSSEEWEPIGYTKTTTEDTPWGASENYICSYTGTFDGAGYTISGINISDDSKSIGSGLFLVVGIFDAFSSFIEQSDGIVKNLIIKEGSVGSISADMNGMICGINTGTIQNCVNNISGGNDKLSYLGGICGTNYGSIIGCVNTGNITAGSASGISAINSGKIEQCYNEGIISASKSTGSAGGISAVTQSGSSIFNCYNSGEIKSEGCAAGITYILKDATDTGIKDISIKNCHNYGTLEGDLHEAGICCIENLNPVNDISIENNYYKDDIAEYGFLYVSGSYETPDTDESKTKAKSAEAFDNGEVLWFLQQKEGDERVWTQGINDDYPVFISDNNKYKAYRVTFDYNCDELPDTYQYTIEYKKETVTFPADPTREGYNFLGWSDKEEGDVINTENIPITQDITYYAQWQKIETEEPEQPGDEDEDQGNTGIHKPQRPIKYYNIYVDTICPGLEVEVSKDVVQEGHQVSAYLTIQAECDTTGMRFEYKRGLFGYWKDLKELEGVQPGEYIIKNIYTDIYIRALDATLPEEEPTGIENLEGVKAYAKDGSIYVYTPSREEVTIISMSGAIIKHEEQVGLQSYNVSRGIYIVRIGEKVFKLKN